MVEKTHVKHKRALCRFVPRGTVHT
ncbi:unnamed protein product [Ectocarpus sp. CCAP 1310/34]|nr:unnamed protein product [Ectocarpus sp. CCAP 1310/34]